MTENFGLDIFYGKRVNLFQLFSFLTLMILRPELEFEEGNDVLRSH